MVQNKLRQITNNCLPKFLILLLIGGSCFAKMAAPMSVSASDTVSFYKSQQKTKKLSSEDSKKLNLALFARDFFDISEFFISGYGTTTEEKIKAVSLNSIARSIEMAIQQKSSWDNQKTASDLSKMKQAGELVKKALGKDSYVVAWFSYQNGDKGEAKSILSRAFDNSYNEVMKLKELTGFRNENPLQQAELTSKALIPMATDPENKSRELQMKKMRTHLSGLPNMQIMT